MSSLDERLIEMKRLFEDSIKLNGIKGKESLIRSSAFINCIHDAVKFDLIERGINPLRIQPRLNETKPEMKIAGFLKRKDQDVCVTPGDIKPSKTKITWGPEAVEDVYDEYGKEYTRHTLVINVRSQMSSLAKNTDTLFERTFAEPLNLHMVHPDLVVGEVYLIPVYEYDQSTMDKRKINFVNRHTNLEKYISFFSAISGRTDPTKDQYKYERCALLIVDFKPDVPKLYHNTQELKEDGLVSESFSIEYANISYDAFISDILSIYDERFGLEHIQKGTLYF